MPIRPSKFFPESALAHELLDGLAGVEIGGAAHNSFGLDTINVDRISHTDPTFKPYADEQIRLCGEVMPVDVVAPGNQLPFADKSYDFVISSHVIEHFYDPIGAIKEWMRVATKYIFIIAPLRDALESDRDKPITPLQELIDRHEGTTPAPEVETDEHHTRWEPQGFANMLMWIYTREWGANWETCAVEVPDKKVQNGMCFVLKYIGE